MTEADGLHEACELFERGAEDDAVRAARAADGQLGSAAEALNAIGTAFAKLSKVALARRAYEASAAADPSFYKPHANLAKLAKDAGDLDGAIVALATATALAPDQARLWTRLGAARLEAGASAEAADALAKAAALEGTEVARLGAAAAYAQALDVEKVVELLRDATGRAALALRAEAVAEIARRGRNGRPPVYSIALLQDELAVSPGNPALLHGLAMSHFGVGDVRAALRELEQIDDSVATAAQASDLLFTELHAGIWSRTERLARHVAWAERHAPLSEPVHHLALGARPPRLRVGFLSGDLHPTHAVFRFARAAFFGLDPARFEVVLFDTRASGRWDASAPFRVCDVSRASDAGVADLIAKEEIHILVDLSGHTGGNSLVALRHKPAPVLATWLGYPTTTGLAAVDYRITDAFADPPGAEADHTEKLIRLPHHAWCYPFADLPTPMPRTGAVHFGSANRAAKVSDATLAAWAEILGRTEGARLDIKGRGFESAEGRQRVRTALGARGIDPARVSIAGWRPSHDEHLDFYREVDVVLDTFPYAGTTTTCEALGSGVPVVTLAGDTHVSRVGVSLLGSVGLTDCIASTWEEYVDLAVGMANAPERRAALRRALRATCEASPLGDAAGFARDFGLALDEMWTRGPRTRA